MTTAEAKADMKAQMIRLQEEFNQKAKRVGIKKLIAVENSCTLIVNSAKKLMQETTTAYEYLNTATFRMVSYNVRRSLPLYAPAPQVGSAGMWGSITKDVTVSGNQVSGRAGSTITNPPYPAYLENGTSKMAPRPWLLPALDINRSKIEENLKAVFNDEPMNIEISEG